MLNEALRLLRVFNDVKAKELADRLNISSSYLSEIENGKKNPSLNLINQYAKVFNVPTSSILFFSEQLNKDEGKIKKKLSSMIINFLQKIENAAE